MDKVRLNHENTRAVARGDPRSASASSPSSSATARSGIIGGTPYRGEYTVKPLPFEQTVLDTDGKLMRDDVTVLEIPFYQTSNPSGGYTAIIGD